MRFQQFTGPVMAKSAEDTAFYCFNRLAALMKSAVIQAASEPVPKSFIAKMLQSRRRMAAGGCSRPRRTIPSAAKISAPG